LKIEGMYVDEFL